MLFSLHSSLLVLQSLMKEERAQEKVIGKDFGVIGMNEPSTVASNGGNHTFARHSPHPTLDNYGEGISHI